MVVRCTVVDGTLDGRQSRSAIEERRVSHLNTVFFRQIDLHVFSCIAYSSIVSLKRVSRYARLILVTSNVLRLNACNIANGMKHVSRMMGHCYCCCC